MWTRQQLKEHAKLRFKPTYWKTVLVSLLFAFIGGGMAAGSSSLSGMTSGMTSGSPYNTGYSNYGGYSSPFSDPAFLGIFFGIFSVTFLIILAIAILFNTFLLNPINVGCRRFFLTNLNVDADVKEVCYTFDRGYKNGVKVMFFRDLYTFLWSLLFIIPGIIKSYEYRMIPYLLAENPDMDKDAAFAVSKQMMYGNKWKAFVLDLSFIGWYILSALTCGILSIFYVDPYKNLTDAGLYLTLKYHYQMQNAQAQANYAAQQNVPVQSSTPGQYGTPAQSSTPEQYSAPTQSSTPGQYSAPTQSDTPAPYNAPTQSDTPAPYDAPVQKDSSEDTTPEE